HALGRSAAAATRSCARSWAGSSDSDIPVGGDAAGLVGGRARSGSERPRGRSIRLMEVLQPTPSESDVALFARWREQGDREAREELVRRYMPHVRSLANRYSYTSEPVDDLVQVGCVGLLQAMSRYDPGVGSSFRAYATPTI